MEKKKEKRRERGKGEENKKGVVEKEERNGGREPRREKGREVGKGREKGRLEGEKEEKQILKDLIKKHKIIRSFLGNCNCPGGPPGPLRAVLEGLSSLLRHRTNDSPGVN